MAVTVAANSYGLFERHDDWSNCAWFYLDRPENGLPALAPVAERLFAHRASSESAGSQS